jgi:hypothetical protein
MTSLPLATPVLFAEYADYIDDISRDCRWHFTTSGALGGFDGFIKAQNFCLTTSFLISKPLHSLSYFFVFFSSVDVGQRDEWNVKVAERFTKRQLN